MKNLKTTLLISIFILSPFSSIFAQTFEPFNYAKNDVQVTTENNILTVKNKQI